MIVLDFKEYRNVENLPQVDSQKIFITAKQEKFHENGLYSEQLFGPVLKNMCQCKKIFGQTNVGTVCNNCGVLCGDDKIRSTTFGKIKFPENIWVVNPEFKNILQKMFGQNSIRSLLQMKDYQTNKEKPYYFSLIKMKLIKESKMKEDEPRIEFPVYNIITLKEIFDQVREISKDPEDENYTPKFDNFLESFVADPEFLDYIFMDYVLVIPPNSRQIVKISPTKILPHPITKNYSEILKNKTKSLNVSDQLFTANPDFFGYTIYKYQTSVDEIYEIILEYNFQKKESYIREAMAGKTVEFSQRSVVVPNPVLRPYQVGMNLESVKKLFLPELLRYLYLKYQDNKIAGTDNTITEFIQYVYNSFEKDFTIDLTTVDIEEFLRLFMQGFKILAERNPTLWRYNIAGFVVARVFDDEDIIRLKSDELTSEILEKEVKSGLEELEALFKSDPEYMMDSPGDDIFA